MIMIITLAIAIPLIIAFLWGLYYAVKKLGREKEELKNYKGIVTSDLESKADIIKRRSDAVITVRNRLHRDATDR